MGNKKRRNVSESFESKEKKKKVLLKSHFKSISRQREGFKIEEIVSSSI